MFFPRWLSTFKKKVMKRKVVKPVDDEENVVVAAEESVRLDQSQLGEGAFVKEGQRSR